MHCSNCGDESAAPEAAYCSRCGARLLASEAEGYERRYPAASAPSPKLNAWIHLGWLLLIWTALWLLFIDSSRSVEVWELTNRGLVQTRIGGSDSSLVAFVRLFVILAPLAGLGSLVYGFRLRRLMRTRTEHPAPSGAIVPSDSPTVPVAVARPRQPAGSIGAGIAWMLLLLLLLFWLPLLGPFIAGVVGGKKSGGIGNAIVAVFLPCVAFAVLLFGLATTLSGLPLIGAIAGGGGLLLSILHIGPLLVGAIFGGLTA